MYVAALYVDRGYMRRPGFFLIEILVYMLGATLLIMLVMHYAVNTTHLLKTTTERVTRMMSLCSALDLVCRDLAAAPCAGKEWKVLQPTMLIWQQGDQDIGWLFNGVELVRCEGNYRQNQGHWKSVVKSVAAHNLRSVTFSVAHRSLSVVRSIHITASDIHGNTMERLCALHARNNT
jgi:hypothetical protein